MPPSLRRRGQPPQQQFHDSDEELDDELEDEIEGAMREEDDGDSEDGLEDEEDDGEEEEHLVSPSHSSQTHHAPIPPHFREISTLASWTVSSSKPGCSIPQLRSPSSSLFWQSDGPQPHYLNIHFFKLVRIVGLRLFLDFEADESYTPTRIVFLAGSGGNDLVEWGEMRLEQPRGWVWADFSGVGDADDDDDEDDGDGEEEEEEEDDNASATAGNENTPAQQHATPHDRSGSDFENAQPAASGYSPDTTGIDYSLDIDNDDDSMMLDFPAAAGAATHPHHHQTPQHQHQPPSSPMPVHTHQRPHPRRPLSHLTPSSAAPARAPKRAKKVKTPVLRAHLVQIKILENHQNGKDTHLRGLQIFARDDDGERTREARAPSGRKSIVGGGKSSLGNGMGVGGEGRLEAWLGKSSELWDGDDVIR